MRIQTLKLDRYLRPGETFHFARTPLRPGPPTALHRHDFFECFWIESGTATHRINGRKVELLPGAVVFIRPDDRHAFQTADRHGSQLANLAFPLKTAEHLRRRYAGDVSERFFWSSSDEPERYSVEQPTALARLSDDLNQARRTPGVLDGVLLQLMTRLIRASHTITHTAPHWLMEACRAVEDPAVFRIGVTGLVGASGRTHEHVCRVMQLHLGTSPTAYINRVRMAHAARLLEASSEPIVQIALDCGIENLSHFYKLFQREHLLTPRAYRRRHGADLVGSLRR